MVAGPAPTEMNLSEIKKRKSKSCRRVPANATALLGCSLLSCPLSMSFRTCVDPPSLKKFVQPLLKKIDFGLTGTLPVGDDVTDTKNIKFFRNNS
jgi:hypothetical protein